MSDSAKARKLVQSRDRLRIEQNLWTPTWRDCAAFCNPGAEKAIDYSYATLTQQIKPYFNPVRQSSTAIDSLNVLSGGLRSWLIPGGDEGWGGTFEPDPNVDPSDDYKDWLADCTSRALPLMTLGAFFLAGHEMFEYVATFGTAGFLIDTVEDDSGHGSPVMCHALMPQNFVFQRDWMGNIIVVHITWSKPASEIVEKFNEPGDEVPEKIRNDVAGNSGNNVYELVQSIYLRSDGEMEEYRPMEPKGQKYGSCWIDPTSNTILRERGFYECPFFAPRWKLWQGTGPSNFGTSPAMQAIADCKGLNLLDMVMATRAELEINPRVKVLPEQTGSVDLSPGGMTMASSENSVTTWAEMGSYQIGRDQNDIITKRIQRAFFTDLFEAVTPIAQQREMNIPVAQAVQREAADRITPAMGRIEHEFFHPGMNTIFMILLRAGKFESPPQDGWHTDVAGKQHFILPQVVQANRWTRTVNARKSQAFISSLGRAMQVAQVKPDIFDRYNFDKAFNDLDRGDGLPMEWIFSADEIRKMQAARAQAAQQQMAQQTAAQAMAGHPLDMARIATGQIPQAKPAA